VQAASERCNKGFAADKITKLKRDSSTNMKRYANRIIVRLAGLLLIETAALRRKARDTFINLDWINAKLQYGWAEVPVMCNRNGYCNYFPAGHVSRGYYVLRGTTLTADSTKWERLGEFFKQETDPKTGLRRLNHISAAVQLSDGT